MSIADDVETLETELHEAKSELKELRQELDSALSRGDDLLSDLEWATKFIEYVHKTNPELREAFEAANKLEGASP